MNKLTSLVIGCVLATGCKDKQPARQSSQGSAQPQGSAQTIAADPQWATKLPPVTGGDTQLLLQFASGLVRIGPDGSLAVANAPTTEAADPRTPGTDPFAGGKVVELGAVSDALGLPPIVRRPESAYGVIESGSAAGSSAAGEGNPADIAYAQLGHPVPARGAPQPTKRVTTAFALAHPNDVSGGVILFADAGASATTLVDVLAQTGGFLAVRNGDKLGALSIALDRHAPAPGLPTRSWREVRIGTTIELETVPGTPTPVESIAKLGEAVKASGATTIDLLVSSQTKVADVVAAIEQLRAAGVEAIGLGAVPGKDSGVRGTEGPRVVAWDFYVANAEAAAAEPYVAALDATYEPMRACYETALAKSKDLTGTATVDVFIAASGKVAGSESRGVSPAIATCIANAIKPVAFPQPGADGGKLTAKIAFLPR